MERRTLDFRCADEVIHDIRGLQSQGYQQLGNWNLTQICEHLAATMNGGMDGFGFRMPWILRATVNKWVFAYARKKRRLFRGAPTFKTLKPTHSDTADDETVIDQCVESLRRAEAFQGPIIDYPLLDDLPIDQWRDFMWIHASHHLSFLIPNQNQSQSA